MTISLKSDEELLVIDDLTFVSFFTWSTCRFYRVFSLSQCVGVMDDMGGEGATETVFIASFADAGVMTRHLKGNSGRMS